MGFDVLGIIYNGQYANATPLQVLNIKSVNLEDTFFGGIGRGKYVINSTSENLTNVNAPNRLDTYIRRDTLSVSLPISSTTMTVHDGTRFSVGQSFSFYDGVNYSISTIASISGNVITYSPANNSAFALGTTVLVLRHTGRISSVDADVNLKGEQNIETMSYFQELSNFIVNENVQKGNGPGFECGWIIWNTLQKYASSLDMSLSASNFVKSTDGNPANGGTGQIYSGTNANTPLLSFLQEVVNVANGLVDTSSGSDIPTGTTYNLWVDEHNALHFGPINVTTPSVTHYLNSYSSDTVGDGLINVVKSHVTHDNDLTAIINTYKGVGGKDASGAPVTAVVFDQASVNQYGQKEGVITNPSLTSIDSLKAFLTARLNQTAFPVRQYTTEIEPFLTYVNCRDFVSITGFTDSHSENFTPQAVETSWDAESTNQQFRQHIVGAEILPDINRVIRAINAEHYIPTTGVTNGGVNLTDRFVQSGLDGSYSYQGTTFAIASGIMNMNVVVSGPTLLTEFDIPAFSFIPTADDTYTIAYAYRNSDGTKLTSPQMVSYSGFSTTATPGFGYTDYQVVPLWVVTRTGGYITHGEDRRFIGGIKSANINAGSIGVTQLAPNPNLNTAPVLKGGTSVSGPTYPVTGGGSYDAAFTFTLSITNPSWLSDVRIYACPVNQAYKNYRVFKGDYTPNSSGSFSIAVNLPSGTAYDIFACFIDQQSNESQDTMGTPIALKIGTTVQQPLSSGAFPDLPTGISPVPSNSPAIAYPNVGSATYDAQSAISFTNGSTSQTGLAIVEAIAQPSNQTSNWTVYNEYPANSSGIYSVVWGGLGAGGTYTLGIRYKSYQDKESNILTIGTTTANPLQGAAIATGSIDVTKTTGIFDGNGQMLFTKSSPATQVALNPDGTIKAQQVTGQLPAGTNSANVVSTIAPIPTTGTNGNTYLTNNAVSTNQVQQVAIIGTQLYQTRYDSTLANTYNGYNGYSWYKTGVGAISSFVDGDFVFYDVGTGTDTTTAAPTVDYLQLAASAKVVLNFKHSIFKAGGTGQIYVNFTGASTSTSGNAANSVSVVGSDQPSITSSTAAAGSESLVTHAVGATTLNASITQTSNTTSYTLTRHSQSFNNSNNTNHYNGVIFTAAGGLSQSTSATQGVFIDISSYTTTDNPDNCGGFTSYADVPSPNSSLNFVKITCPTGNYADASHSISLNYNFPASVTLRSGRTAGNIAYTDAHNIDRCLSVSARSTSTTYALSWTVTGYSPSGVVLGATTNVTGASTLSFAGNGETGQYYFNVKPQFDNDPGSANATPANGTSIGGNQTATSWANTTGFTGTDSASFTQYATVNCVAPTSAATQLSLTIAGTAYGTDAYGNGYSNEIVVQKADGSQTWVIDTRNPATNAAFTYYNASETCTSFYIYMRSIATSTGSGFSGTLSYYPNIAITYGYATNDSNSATYSYPASNSPVASFYTDNNSNIDAPNNVATPVGVVISSLSNTSNSYGASTLYLYVYDKNNNVVVNGQQVTATGTYSYSNASATAGQYRFDFYNQITANNNNASGTQTFASNFSGYTYDYNHINSNTTTFTDNAGNLSTYLTASSTIAPTTTTLALNLNLTSVTTDTSGIYGINRLVVRLKKPDGTYVLDSSASSGFQFSTDGGSTWTAIGPPSAPWVIDSGIAGVYGYPIQYRYFNASAVGGVYTWVVYGQVNANNTGNQQYLNSWSGTQTYYTAAAAGTGKLYIVGNDAASTARLATNDANINFYSLTPDSVGIQIINDATIAQNFTISIDCKSV